MNCDTHGVVNSSTDPELNLRLGRSHRTPGRNKDFEGKFGDQGRASLPRKSVRRCESGGLFKKRPNKLAGRGVGVQNHFVSLGGQRGIFSRRGVRGCVYQVAAC